MDNKLSPIFIHKCLNRVAKNKCELMDKIIEDLKLKWDIDEPICLYCGKECKHEYVINHFCLSSGYLYVIDGTIYVMSVCELSFFNKHREYLVEVITE